MAGDYNDFHKQYGRDRHTQLAVNATGADQVVITAKNAFHKLNIQRILVAPTTFAAVTWTFKETDSTGAAIGIVNIPASQGTGPGQINYVVDFGPHGWEMAAGKNLWLDLSATGAAGNITVDAYERPINALSMAQAASA